ncbi:MAG TPA: FAD-binding protein [Candidatus Kapabacteria bacterium]|nr:FAD-binding protein [Candidatus Kapabacteria bacterium]
MPTQIDLELSPEAAHDEAAIKRAAAMKAGVAPESVTAAQVLRRSLDARKREIKIRLRVDLYVGEHPSAPVGPKFDYRNVRDARRAIIVGAGPAGLFAALRMIELGVKPIILERGKDVRARRRDLAVLNREHIVDPDSNYCFGEGGAGTYSDGKLYTRSDKRGNIRRVLDILVEHGATTDILVEAHPHIGTNKLPAIIERIRETILNSGGEIHFDTRVRDFIVESNRMTGVIDANDAKWEGEAVVLATGHSARDIFQLLHNKKIAIEAKPFSLGVRIEHPQELIDRIQYKCDIRSEFLPPANYSLVEQVNDRGVYSFCMCPGGIIAPCATSQEEIVVNGWSPSRRNNPFANSGTVVAIELEDMRQFHSAGALMGVRYQQYVEKAAWVAGGKTQVAPAQRMVDFFEGKLSNDLPKSSYQPGLHSATLKDVLPKHVHSRLRLALPAFGRKMRGYYTNDAVLVATESRTSSPVRIPRDHETLQHTEIEGLYPSGEGAGYAGGIVSAAMDGERIAEALAKKFH